jgi:D-xylulose reductase
MRAVTACLLTRFWTASALSLPPWIVGNSACAPLGSSSVVAIDVARPRLDIAAALGPVRAVEAGMENPVEVVKELTGGWGADVVFEASGSPDVSSMALEMLCPGGRLVYVGMPVAPISFDVVQAQSKEISMSTIFRYANVYSRALALMGSGKIKLLPLITETYPFDRSIEAYDYAVRPRPESVKIQIKMS